MNGAGLRELVLPPKDRLDYLRAWLEALALLVALVWLAWYTSRVGPGRAAERIARGTIAS